MTWFGWTLIALQLVSLVLSAAIVGKPRQPLTAGTFAGMTAVTLFIVAGALFVGTGSVA